MYGVEHRMRDCSAGSFLTLGVASTGPRRTHGPPSLLEAASTKTFVLKKAGSSMLGCSTRVHDGPSAGLPPTTRAGHRRRNRLTRRTLSGSTSNTRGGERPSRDDSGHGLARELHDRSRPRGDPQRLRALGAFLATGKSSTAPRASVGESCAAVADAIASCSTSTSERCSHRKRATADAAAPWAANPRLSRRTLPRRPRKAGSPAQPSQPRGSPCSKRRRCRFLRASRRACASGRCLSVVARGAGLAIPLSERLEALPAGGEARAPASLNARRLRARARRTSYTAPALRCSNERIPPLSSGSPQYRCSAARPWSSD
jgi:hypothetical protein